MSPACDVKVSSDTNMRNYNLGFISDQNIYNHVKETVEKDRFTINLNEFIRNRPDPSKLTFDAGIDQKDIESIIENEAFRQMDKSNNNYSLLNYHRIQAIKKRRTKRCLRIP